MFDKMLGIEKDPKLAKIRDENPLNKIAVPSAGVGDLESRIGQYYIPVVDNPNYIHPLLEMNSTGDRKRNMTLANSDEMMSSFN